MKVVILNSFSLSIFSRQEGREFDGDSYIAYHLRAAATAVMQFIPITTAAVKDIIGIADEVENFIGHADTASMVGTDLGLSLIPNRDKYTFSPSDNLIVAQYTGPRLPEGCQVLPDGSTLSYWLVVSDYHRD